MEFRHHPERRARHWLSMPFIYSMIIPLVILDLFLEAYHRVCFPLYGIPIMKRRTYIRIDRHRLPYLRWWEKLHCVYCGYANGLLGYAAAIAGATERYWCGIRHREDAGFHPPAHQKDFLAYGDAGAFREFVKKKQ